MHDFESLKLRLHSLVLYRGLRQDRIFDGFSRLLEGSSLSPTEQVEAYVAFISALFEETRNWTNYLLNRTLEEETIFDRLRGAGSIEASTWEESLREELQILTDLSRLTATSFRETMTFDGYLPNWETEEVDFHQAYQTRMLEIKRIGYGMYARHHMFLLEEEGITPVRFPDPIRLSGLIGYERERSQIIGNTLDFLAGKTASNGLLYGDAGTGKSSTVKAIANAYKDQGLRLIEIPKNRLSSLPSLMDQLSHNPLHFILFLDDLSFSQAGQEFHSLKAVLEGSVAAKPTNVVLYATSNRRHLIKETFSEREGDDLHRRETIEEQVALSDRFGLSVYFGKPNKQQFLNILWEMAQKSKIQLDRETLEREGERYALERGGRSPRIARQFIQSL